MAAVPTVPAATSSSSAGPSLTLPAVPLPAPLGLSSPSAGTILNYETGEERYGQSLKFSPYDGNRIACSTGGEYGLGGPGHIIVLERDDNSGQFNEVLVADYRDNLLDICWSETNPNVLTTAGGDGFVQVWDLSSRFPKVPVHEFKGHKLEMSSVEWSPARFGNTLLTACWDGQVNVYDMSGPWPLSKMTASEVIVYQAAWSPHNPYNYICVSQEGILQMWDMYASCQKAQIYMHISDTEILACDWAKYTQNLVVTAGADCTVKGWDLRNYSTPLFHILDHGHAVRRVKFSPYHPTILASVSYDMSLRIFDYHASNENLEIVAEHTEFVYGLDWNLHYKGELATCGFDRTLKVLTPKCLVGT